MKSTLILLTGSCLFLGTFGHAATSRYQGPIPYISEQELKDDPDMPKRIKEATIREKSMDGMTLSVTNMDDESEDISFIFDNNLTTKSAGDLIKSARQLFKKFSQENPTHAERIAEVRKGVMEVLVGIRDAKLSTSSKDDKKKDDEPQAK